MAPGSLGEMIVGNLTQNAKTAQQVIAAAVEQLPFERTCECAQALKNAIITRPDAVPDDVRRALGPLVSKYI
jgi:5'-methylthioadenosine phosphorylase